MYNNASYRRFNVSGTTSFSFSAVGSTVRTTPAINAWTGATINTIEPEPGVDGRGFIAYKVTGPVAGVWHYEYAINNQNLDRGIQSFSVALGCGNVLTNVGFHAPPNHPGFSNDGTVGGAGYSNAAWTSNQTATDISWSSETFAQNPNANAIRWGTLYNFRFDSTSPPQRCERDRRLLQERDTRHRRDSGSGAGDLHGVTPTPTPPIPTPLRHRRPRRQLRRRPPPHRPQLLRFRRRHLLQLSRLARHRSQRPRPSTSRPGCECSPVTTLASAGSSSREARPSMCCSGPLDPPWRSLACPTSWLIRCWNCTVRAALSRSPTTTGETTPRRKQRSWPLESRPATISNQPSIRRCFRERTPRS